MNEPVTVKTIFQYHRYYNFVPYDYQVDKQYLIVNNEDLNQSIVVVAGLDDNNAECIYSFKCLMSNHPAYIPDNKFNRVLLYGDWLVTEL